MYLFIVIFFLFIFSCDNKSEKSPNKYTRGNNYNDDGKKQIDSKSKIDDNINVLTLEKSQNSNKENCLEEKQNVGINNYNLTDNLNYSKDNKLQINKNTKNTSQLLTENNIAVCEKNLNLDQAKTVFKNQYQKRKEFLKQSTQTSAINSIIIDNDVSQKENFEKLHQNISYAIENINNGKNKFKIQDENYVINNSFNNDKNLYFCINNANQNFFLSTVSKNFFNYAKNCSDMFLPFKHIIDSMNSDIVYLICKSGEPLNEINLNNETCLNNWKIFAKKLIDNWQMDFNVSLNLLRKTIDNQILMIPYQTEKEFFYNKNTEFENVFDIEKSKKNASIIISRIWILLNYNTSLISKLELVQSIWLKLKQLAYPLIQCYEKDKSEFNELNLLNLPTKYSKKYSINFISVLLYFCHISNSQEFQILENYDPIIRAYILHFNFVSPIFHNPEDTSFEEIDKNLQTNIDDFNQRLSNLSSTFNISIYWYNNIINEIHDYILSLFANTMLLAYVGSNDIKKFDQEIKKMKQKRYKSFWGYADKLPVLYKYMEVNCDISPGEKIIFETAGGQNSLEEFVNLLE